MEISQERTESEVVKKKKKKSTSLNCLPPFERYGRPPINMSIGWRRRSCLGPPSGSGGFCPGRIPRLGHFFSLYCSTSSLTLCSPVEALRSAHWQFFLRYAIFSGAPHTRQLSHLHLFSTFRQRTTPLPGSHSHNHTHPKHRHPH